MLKYVRKAQLLKKIYLSKQKERKKEKQSETLFFIDNNRQEQLHGICLISYVRTSDKCTSQNYIALRRNRFTFPSTMFITLNLEVIYYYVEWLLLKFAK